MTSKKARVEATGLRSGHGRGLDDIHREELKQVASNAGVQPSGTVQWSRIPRDILARVVMSNLDVAGTRRLQATEKRLATLPPGSVNLPIVELGNDELHTIADSAEWTEKFQRQMPIWSQKTRRLTLDGGHAIKRLDWFRADTFVRLEALHVDFLAVDAARWTALMTHCPALHELDVDTIQIAPSVMTLDVWKRANQHRWTIVRIKGEWPDSLGGVSASATIMTFVQPRLQALELGTYMHHTWTPDSSKELIANIDPKTFKRWTLPCGLETKSAEEHLQLLMDRLPGLEHFDLDCGLEHLPAIRVKTLEHLLKTWTFITEFPPSFIRLSEPCPTTVALPDARAWTEVDIDGNNFADWSLDQLLGFIQRSTQWQSIVWKKFAPGQIMDSKTLGLVIEQLKAPLHILELRVPVVPSHANIIALSHVRLVAKEGREPLIALGPSAWTQQFGQEINQNATDVGTDSLLEFVANGRPVGRKATLFLTYVPIRVQQPTDLYALGYNQNVTMNFWISHNDTLAYQQAFAGQPFWTVFTSRNNYDYLISGT